MRGGSHVRRDHRPKGRLGDGRHLGLVNVGFLRGNPASHDPGSHRGASDACPAVPADHRASPGAAADGYPRHEVLGAIGVGAKPPTRAIASGNVERRFSRPLTLRTSGEHPLEGQPSRGGRSSCPTIYRGSGMFSRSVVVHARTCICRSRPSARGLETPAIAVCGKGLAEVFEPPVNTRGGCPPLANGGSAPSGRPPARGSRPVGLSSMEGALRPLEATGIDVRW